VRVLRRAAALAGTAISCVVPLLSFAAGISIERFRLPFEVQWRGFGKRADEEEGE
jgi:hypothetical protein